MTTEITTRGGLIIRNDPFRGGLAGSFLLHGGLVALLVGWALLFHTGENWGNSTTNAGAIQATMVSAIPLPPKVTANQENVLATENPSPAPAPPTPKAVEIPHPDAIPIPVKPTKPPKLAEKAAPPPPLHPQPVKPQIDKATAGEAPASIPMSSTQTQVGTFSVGETDTTFGTRFGYYNEQIKRKLESAVVFRIARSPGPGPPRLHHVPCSARRYTNRYPYCPAQWRRDSRSNFFECRPPRRHLRPLARCVPGYLHQRHVLL